MDGFFTEIASLVLTYAVLGAGTGLLIVGINRIFGKKGGRNS